MSKTTARQRRRNRSPFAGATRPDLRMLRTLATGIERHTIGVVFKAGNVSCRCGHRLGPPPRPEHIVRIRPMTAEFLAKQPGPATYRPRLAA
ncbi:hypothetical protein [Frigoribacterium sp. MCBA15_019]|uniref:hypothetical protein n=1 Tax=Frigoribacterium sp. MCBA15_019 TaxID=1898745 RepID=UPI0008DC8313|nr:hypothetical protein [Frigoribacterium sp. MCBA15_019]OII27317.1 hypothetical protein BIV04_01790 [Frigoribacterium sp. MCBA15_019]